jgi:hypothetical protein
MNIISKVIFLTSYIRIELWKVSETGLRYSGGGYGMTLKKVG